MNTHKSKTNNEQLTKLNGKVASGGADSEITGNRQNVHTK